MVLAAAGFAGWRAMQTRAAWLAAVPALPDLAAFPGELHERVSALAMRATARDVAALGELSRLYHANSFQREAALAYAGLLQFDSTNPRWPHLLAHVLAGSGQLTAAVPLWRRTTELAPEYLPAHLRWGEALLKTNQAAAAAEVYAVALARAPQDPYALLGLARCELQLERMTAARERLQQAVNAQPEFGVAWNLLATVYERLGNTSGAATARTRAAGTKRFREMPDPWLDELLEDCYDVYRLRVAASAAKASGDPRGALPWLERALRLAPENSAAHRDLGDVWAELREFPRAQEEFERAAALEPADENGYLRWVAACNVAGDTPAAARALAVGLEHCADSPGLNFAHGKWLAGAARWDEALAAFATARRLKPEAPEAYHEIATIHFRFGRDAEGVAALEAVLVHAPDHLDTLRALARRAIELGDAAAAVRWLERVRARADLNSGLDGLVAAYVQRFGRAPW